MLASVPVVVAVVLGVVVAVVLGVVVAAPVVGDASVLPAAFFESFKPVLTATELPAF